jgi:hypothetical protein
MNRIKYAGGLKGQMYNSSGRAPGARGKRRRRKEEEKTNFLVFTSKWDDVIETRSRNTHRPDARIDPGVPRTTTV